MRTLAILILTASGVLAQNPPAKNLSQAEIDDIVQKFAAKETAFARAREAYTYRQTARIQELDDSGTIIGRWETVSDIIFSPEGKRTERVVRAPVPTLKNIGLTPEDLKDMQDVQPFVLTSPELPKYFVRFLGRQKVDEIGCYVFAVKPKKMEGKDRYFIGQVWVDDQDMQIVKTYGRAFGLANLAKSNANQSPKFETYREQIDGKYWFPTYTIANDTLHFENLDQRIRQTIRYEDYKVFGAQTTITFGDEVKDTPAPVPQNAPTLPPKKP